MLHFIGSRRQHIVNQYGIIGVRYVKLATNAEECCFAYLLYPRSLIFVKKYSLMSCAEQQPRSAIMSQQVLKAAAPVLKRMPLAALLPGQARSTAEILHQKHQEDDAKTSNVDASVSTDPAEAPQAQTVLRVRSYQLSCPAKSAKFWA